MFWDFISLRPETTHQVSFLFSDRGTPDGYRHLHGFGSHTFKLVNAKVIFLIYLTQTFTNVILGKTRLLQIPFQNRSRNQKPFR
jgi:hypothetical protein